MQDGPLLPCCHHCLTIMSPCRPTIPKSAVNTVNTLGNLILRITCATLGSYAVGWLTVTLLCVYLPFSRVTLWYFTGQLIPLPLLGVVLWAFASDKISRLLYGLGGFSVLATIVIAVSGAQP